MVATQRYPAHPLAGRVRERSFLTNVVAGLSSGVPGVVIVHGEAGVGKTRLVRDVCDEVATQDVEVLWGTCVHFGASTVPYAPIAAALERWNAGSGDGWRAEALATSGVASMLSPSRPADAALERSATLLPSIDALLARIAEHTPTVLVIDDLQWADVTSLDVLAYVITGLRNRRLGLVLTIRDEDRPEGHRLHEWLADVRRLEGVSEMVLGRLSLEETEDQICQLREEPPSEDFAAAVHRRSGGNPYLTELLVRDLPSHYGRLPAEPTQALRDAVLARWHTMPAPARRAARILAIGGRPRPPDALSAVLSRTDPGLVDVSGLMGQGVDFGVLQVAQGGAYWFRHPLLAEVLTESLTAAIARPVHAAYAEILEPAAGAGDPAAAADVAFHHEHAGHVDAAFAWSLAAATEATGVAAAAEAGRALDRACELWDQVSVDVRGDEAERVRLLRRAARATRASGDLTTSVARLSQALLLVDPRREPLTTSALLVDWCTISWIASPGRTMLRPELRQAVTLTDRAPDSPERAVALAELAVAQAWDEVPDPSDAHDGSSPVPGRSAARAGVDVARRSGSRQALARAKTAQGRVEIYVTGTTSLAQLREAYALAATEGDAAVMGSAAIWWTNLLLHEGRCEEAAEVCRRASREVLAAGDSITGHFLAAHGAATLFVLGRWEESRALIRPALVSGRRGIAGAMASCVATLMATRSGELDQARRHLERLNELVQADFTGVGLTEATVELLLALGDPPGAVEHLRVRHRLGAWEVGDGMMNRALCAMATADLAEHARDHHDPTGLRRALDELESLAALYRLGDPHQLAHRVHQPRKERNWTARFAAESARCRGGRGEAAAWAEARQVAHEVGFPWDEALAGWRLAQTLVKEGSARDAVAAAVRGAHEIATRLGAAPLVEETLSLAHTAHISLEPLRGAGPTDPALAALAVLTDREREVLDYVVAGRTNAEIALALFISAKTASVHVSNILRKSGTHSRVEAAAWAERIGRAGRVHLEH